jgi:hypothetical protein
MKFQTIDHILTFEFYFLTKFVRTIFHNMVLNISVVGCYPLPFEAIVAHQVACHPSAIYAIFVPPLCIKDITVYLPLCGNARGFQSSMQNYSVVADMLSANNLKLAQLANGCY